MGVGAFRNRLKRCLSDDPTLVGDCLDQSFAALGVGIVGKNLGRNRLRGRLVLLLLLDELYG